MTDSTRTDSGDRLAASYVSSGRDLRVWGLSPRERLRHALAARGIEEVADPSAVSGDRPVLLLRDDCVYDDSVLDGLLRSPGARLVAATAGDARPLAAHVPAERAEDARAWLVGAGDPPPETHATTPEALGGGVSSKLRKRQPPYCLDLAITDVRTAERRIYQAAYKGVTDLVTKYVWPRPAFWATRLCARLGIPPNAVTAVSALAMALALWAFAAGAFGWGLLAAWFMAFLDTVDGKLARVTLTATGMGHYLDHGMDVIHPPFWYVAWAYGLAGTPLALPQPWFAVATATIFGGYVLGRLAETAFKQRFGMELFVWRRFDSLFREITARRNPCLLLLTTGWLAGRPDIGLAATAGWLAISALVHTLRVVQAHWTATAGRTVTSWLDAGA